MQEISENSEELGCATVAVSKDLQMTTNLPLRDAEQENVLEAVDSHAKPPNQKK